ncbi:MAG: tetratricopeptide repeat protein [Puniceicoccales bacterium]|jgi:type III secretion system low calcium response chaperone LcrH/SycD|nr:tetratricopeptide repeat protein [Puniceicoccales bacterium]
MESQFDQILRQHFTAHPLSQNILLNRFPELDFSHLDAAYEIGLELLKQKKYGDAEDIFYCIATMNHFEQRYWKALAVTLLAQKKYQDALGIYLAAFFLDPMDVDVVASMADCCLSLGDREGAKNFLEQTIEIFNETKEREDLAKRAQGLLEMINQKTEEKNEKC